ncbi:hypothetical protein [Cytobacillus firmus]
MKKILLTFMVLISLGTLTVQEVNGQEIEATSVISENGHPIYPPVKAE